MRMGGCHPACAKLCCFTMLVFIFMIGLCFGSFATMASYRLPRDLEWVKGASRCTSCQHQLTIRDLFPVFSWLFNKGRCHYCHQSVSWRYPLVELITALHFVLSYWLYGLTPLMPVAAFFGLLLIIMCVADLETSLIPDEIHFALVPLALFWHWLNGAALLPSAVITGVAAFGFGLLLHYGYFWLRKRHGLGLGDVKFLATAGLWLATAESFVVFIFYSGLMGVILGGLWRITTRQERFPFGPALAVSLYLLVLFPQSGEFFWQTLRDILYE